MGWPHSNGSISLRKIGENTVYIIDFNSLTCKIIFASSYFDHIFDNGYLAACLSFSYVKWNVILISMSTNFR
jgi:hypothetical protein